MSVADPYKVATLGSPATFAGEATAALARLYPEIREIVYFPSMEDSWRALRRGTVDAVVMSAERTGQPHRGDRVLGGVYVVGESVERLRCTLYVKPGTDRAGIRKITGHGSIHQCAAYLDREFPGAERETHGLNSVEAAKAMMAGDGTAAVVGTASLPGIVPGLEVVARDIDDGAMCRWWLVATRPRFHSTPEVLVVTLRSPGDGGLGRLCSAVSALGYHLRTAASYPVNEGISVYDYVLTFTGKGSLVQVQQAVAGSAGARLVGALDQRG